MDSFKLPLFVFLACFLPSLCKAQDPIDEKQLTYVSGIAYYNNQPFSGKTVKYSSVSNDPYTKWIGASANYSEGKRKNVSTYFQNGQKASEMNDETGEYKEWFQAEKGTEPKLSLEGTYKKRKEGKWTYYHSNGKKRAEGYFTNGKRTGKWTYWDVNGKEDPDYEAKKKKSNREFFASLLKLPLYLLYGFK